jgi:hypothetical protein
VTTLAGCSGGLAAADGHARRDENPSCRTTNRRTF